MNDNIFMPINPQISVIVPVYNVENYLHECIDSILNQTFKDFELILVDDGSTDNSGKICDEYAINDKRVRVYHKENGGQSSARNLGISKANTIWIAFIDSDDVVHPRMIEYLKKAIDDNNIKLSACAHKKGEVISDVFFETKQYSFEIIPVTEQAIIQDEGYLSIGHAKSNISMMWILATKLVHKDIAKKYQMTNGRIFEDNAVAMAWCLEAGKVAVVDQEMYFYRQNPASTMHKSFSRKNADYLWAIEQQLKYAHEFGYHHLLTHIMDNYLITCIYMYKKFVNELNDKVFAKQILIHSKEVLYQYDSIEVNDSIQTHLKTINDLLHPIKKILQKKFLSIKMRLFKK